MEIVTLNCNFHQNIIQIVHSNKYICLALKHKISYEKLKKLFILKKFSSKLFIFERIHQLLIFYSYETRETQGCDQPHVPDSEILIIFI